jgi:hypothetical protein
MLTCTHLQAVLSEASGLNSTGIGRRSIQKRGFFDIIDDIVSDVGNAITTVGNTVVDTFNTVASAASNAIQTVVGTASALVKFIATGMYSLSDTFDLNLTPDNVDQNTPFGQAYTIYSSPASGDQSASDTSEIEQYTQLLTTGPVTPGIGVYCVNCGITGQVGVTGSISASLTSGIQQAQIGVGANFQAGATLAISAFTMQDFNKVVNIVQKSLSPWTIPNIVSFGPQFVLSGAASITLQALGQLESGIYFVWPNAQAVLDLATFANSFASGWTPMINTKTQAAGGFSAMASLGLPVALAFELNLLNGKVVVGAAVTDTPEITANAQAGFSFSASNDGSAPTCSITGANGCSGISYSVDTGNSLDFTATGLSDKNLASYQGPNLASGCIQVPLPSSCSSNDKLFDHRTSPLLRPRAAVVEERDSSLAAGMVEASEMKFRRKRQSQSDGNSTSTMNASYANCMDQTGQIGMYPNWNGNLFVAAANATNLTVSQPLETLELLPTPFSTAVLFLTFLTDAHRQHLPHEPQHAQRPSHVWRQQRACIPLLPLDHEQHGRLALTIGDLGQSAEDVAYHHADAHHGQEQVHGHGGRRPGQEFLAVRVRHSGPGE